MSLTNKAMLVNLSISYWTGKKGDDRMTEDIVKARHAQADALETKKLLVDPAAINQVKAVRSRARAYHFERTLPWIDGGTRILPSTYYLEYSEEMRKFRAEYDTAIAEFLKSYPKMKGEARKRLGDLFKDEDYPDAALLKGKFGWSQTVFPIPDKEDWRVDIGAKAEAEVKKQIDARLQEAVAIATRDLWQRLYEPVAKLAERMKDADATFRDTLIGNLRDIVAVLPKMNVGDDPKLTEMAKRVERELCKLNADEIREDDKVRVKASAAADKILAAMAGYIGS